MKQKAGKDCASEYQKLYYQLLKVMNRPQIAAAILQTVSEWNSEIEAAVKRKPHLMTFFRASKITGMVTVKSLSQSYLSGKRMPPQWVIEALREVVKRHIVPVKRQVKKGNDVTK